MKKRGRALVLGKYIRDTRAHTHTKKRSKKLVLRREKEDAKSPKALIQSKSDLKNNNLNLSNFQFHQMS